MCPSPLARSHGHPEQPVYYWRAGHSWLHRWRLQLCQVWWMEVSNNISYILFNKVFNTFYINGYICHKWFLTEIKFRSSLMTWPQIKLHIGWSLSPLVYWGAMQLNDTSREHFVQYCISLLHKFQTLLNNSQSFNPNCSSVFICITI